MFWRTDDSNQAFLEACTYPVNLGLLVKSRKNDAPLAVQGMGYWESGVVLLEQKNYDELYSNMNNNDEYELQESSDGDFAFLNALPGKYRKTCIFNDSKRVVRYTLTYW